MIWPKALPSGAPESCVMMSAMKKPDDEKKPTPWVLVVDDDLFILKVYQAKLAIEHIEYKVASDGEEGLRLAKSSDPPAVVLLDLMLPKKSGFEVLEEIRKDESLKNVAVIIQSNLSQKADADRVMQLGASEFIVKGSIKIDELIARIRHYLSR